MEDAPYWTGESWGSGAVPPSALTDIDRRSFIAKRIAIIAGIVSLCLSLLATVNFAGASNDSTALNDLLNSSSSLSSDSGTSSLDTSWVPTGFIPWSANSNIAWRWAASGTYTCPDYGCISAEFISNTGCPSGVYAAINWMDANAGQGGSVISYANASLPSLRPLQIAKLRFDDIEGTGKSGQMADIKCY